MADWITITDRAPATSGGAAVAQDHVLTLDSVLAVSYREPAAHPGHVGPVAEIHVGAQQPIRLFSAGARDELRRVLDRRVGDAAMRRAYSPSGSRRPQRSSAGE